MIAVGAGTAKRKLFVHATATILAPPRPSSKNYIDHALKYVYIGARFLATEGFEILRKVPVGDDNRLHGRVGGYFERGD